MLATVMCFVYLVLDLLRQSVLHASTIQQTTQLGAFVMNTGSLLKIALNGVDLAPTTA